MSKDIRDILKQIRDGKSSLSSEESRAIEPQLSAIDEFLTSGSIEQEAFLALIEVLQNRSRDLAESSVQQEGDDISTRMTNIAGWELASLMGLISAFHASVAARAKQSPSESCLEMYIRAVDILLAHSEARSRACAATLVRVLSKSLAAKQPPDGAIITVYEVLYAIILRHVQKHLVSREAETRPVRLQGAGDTPQEELDLDDLR